MNYTINFVKNRKNRYYYLFFLFLCSIHVNFIFGQSLGLKLKDTITLNISSETSIQHITFTTKDSILYYFDQNTPQKNGGKLILNTVNSNSKKRNSLTLQDAGDDIDLFQTSFLVVTNNNIILGFRSNKIIFYNKKGELLKRLNLDIGYTNYAYLEKGNKLILIEYYGHHILSRKPILQLLAIDLVNLEIENKKEYFFEGVQLTIYDTKFHASDTENFYIAEPLNNRIYKYDYSLQRVDSIFVNPLSSFSTILNRKLSKLTFNTIKKYDSLVYLQKDSLIIYNAFINDMNLQPRYMLEIFNKDDTLMDRIERINIINGKLYITKKNRGYTNYDSKRHLDIFDIKNKKLLQKDIYYDRNKKQANDIESYYKYCISCHYAIQTIIQNGILCAYQLSGNNFFPEKIISFDDYNKQFDKWMLTNTPTYMMTLYEFQD